MVSLPQSATTAILTNLLVRCASRFSFLEFATALEAEYPKVLAKRMAACLRRQAERQQLQLGPRLSSAQKARHAWGVQTVKGQSLIPEFKDFCHVDAAQNKPGYRLLATPLQGAQHTELPSEDEKQHESEQKRVRKTFKYGIQWKPEEFLSRRNLSCIQRIPKKLCHKC